MGSILSNEGYLGLAKQSAKGSAASSPDIFIKYLEGSTVPEITRSEIREGGDDELLNTVVKTQHKEKITFKVLARPRITAYLYAWLLGEDSVTGSEDPWTHELTRSSGKRCWVTVERMIKTGTIITYTDCKIESIQAEAEAGKEVTLTVEMVALTSVVGSSAETPTYESEAPFMFYDGNGAYSLDGVVTQLIKKFMFKHIITSQDGYQTDGILMADYPDLKLDIQIGLELYTEAVTNWQKANYNADTTPQEALKTSVCEIDLTYTDRQFKIEIGKFVWDSIDLPLKGEPESLTETVAGLAMKPDSGEMTTVTIQNDLSADLATSGS